MPDNEEVVVETQPEQKQEPVIEPTEKPVVKEDPPQKESPSPMAERFANKLKAELGDRYNEKLDKMPIEQRIDTMELLLDALDAQDTLVKSEGKVPLNAKPKTRTKAKTFLQQQKEGNFNLTHRKHDKILKKLYS